MGSSSVVKIVGNDSLTAVTFPLLTNGSTIEINGSLNVSLLNLNTLQHVQSVSIYTNTLTTLNLSNLLTGSITINSPIFTTISLPIMTRGAVSVGSNAITNFSLPMFTNGDVYISGTSLTTVNLPVLATSSNLFIGFGIFATLNFPALVTAGYLHISTNPNLTTVNFPVLTNVSQLWISNNTNLTTITLPVFNSFNNLTNGGKDFQFQNNKLSSTSINYFLNRAVNATPTLGKSIQLAGQTPAAPPTGQGIIDKNTLISQGNNVITD
jgi:hypothetical protein